LSDIYTRIQAGLAAAERVFPILDRESAITDPTNPQPLPQPHRELIFDHVRFRYEPEKPVLDDIDLRIPYGETIAVVGPNGCGKTTLVNLIPRFYDPAEGAVRVDDVDLRDVKLRDLRRRIGLVSQQTLLFDDTVGNNVRYGSPHATDEEVIEAAKKARAHRFIMEDLEQGYDTSVGQGGNRLSGGQRQRIALARAILRDPEILILDEATSQIDLESEQLIHQALEQFVRGRTAVIITHRLSTLDLADRVVVMNAGRIDDVGTHEELIRRCELYRGLYEIHFKQSA
jgi:ATP-binding cassette subfamily B protein/subfamily B ATP-binding cassette protein MsbA